MAKPTPLQLTDEDVYGPSGSVGSAEPLRLTDEDVYGAPPSGRTDLYLQNLGLDSPDEGREEAKRKLAGYAFGKIGEKVGRAGEGVDVEPAVRAQEELIRRYGSSSAERQLKAIESERPKSPVEGELSPLERLLEYGEAAIIGGGAVLGAPAALAVAVPRGLMSGASARADAAGLKGKTRYEREKWLASLNKEDSGYEAYKGLVDSHNEADRVRAEIEKLPEKDRGGFGGILGGMIGSEESTKLHRELFDAESRVTEATASLTKDYFLPGGTRSPYGTRAPVPYEGPSDVTENLLRGVLGMTDSENLAKARNAMQAAGGAVTDALSLPVALYNTETNKFLTTSRLHDAKEEVRQEFEARGEATPTVGVVSAMAQQRLAEQRKRRREAGDITDGLFLPELLALVAPESLATRLLPKAAKVVVTNAGKLTAAGAEYVRDVKGAYRRSLANVFETADAGRIERGLDPVGGGVKTTSFVRLDRAVDLAMAKAGDEALLKGKRLEAVDLSDAIKISDDGGIETNIGAAKPIFADDAMSGTKAVSKDTILADIPRVTDDIFAEHKRRSLVLDSGRKVVAEIDTYLSEPGGKVVQATPAIRAKIGAKKGVPFFGDFAVYSPKSKSYRGIRPSDFNPPRMDHAVRMLAKKRGVDKATIVRLVDEAAHKIGNAAASPGDREVIGEFMELLGNPSQDADDALSLLEGLRGLIKDAVSVIPRMASQADRDATRASAASRKADEKVVELSSRAAESGGTAALAEARLAQETADGLQAEAHTAALLTGADPALVRESVSAREGLVTANKAILSAEGELGAARARAASLATEYDEAARISSAADIERLASQQDEVAGTILDLEGRLAAERAKSKAFGALLRDTQEVVEILNQLKGTGKGVRTALQQANLRLSKSKQAVDDANKASEAIEIDLELQVRRMGEAAEAVRRKQEALFVPEHEPVQAVELLVGEILGSRKAQVAASKERLSLAAREVADRTERLSLGAQKDVQTRRRMRAEGQIYPYEKELGPGISAPLREFSQQMEKAKRAGEKLLRAVKEKDGALEELARRELDQALARAAKKEARFLKELARAARGRSVVAARKAKEFEKANAKLLKAEKSLASAKAASAKANTKLSSARAARKEAKSVVDRLGLEEKPHLDSFVLQALQESMTSAQTVREILHSMMGAATKEEFRKLHSMYKQLRSYEEVAFDRFFVDADRLAAIDRLTVSDATQARRALERFSEGRLSKADFDALPQKAKDAVEIGRRAMNEIYDILVAEGALAGGPGKKAAFFERMRIEGYLPHILTSSGARKLAGLTAKAPEMYRGGLGHGVLSTTILNTFKRKRPGSAKAVNEQIRRDIAESVYDDLNRQLDTRVGQSLDAGDEVMRILQMDKESALKTISQELGLDKFNYFETDPVFAMMEYGRRVGKGLANRRFVRNLRELYQEGESFAARAAGKGGLKTADDLAAKAYYRRLRRATLFDLHVAELKWEGWRKHAKEIREFLDQSGDVAEERFMKKLESLGIDPTKIPRDEVELIWSKHVYVPEPIAKAVDSMARPDWLAGLKDWKIASELGLTFDEMLRTFKVFVTIFAPAFHGRNFISNVVQNTMVHGMDALNPATHTEAIWLMNAPEDKKWTLTYVDSAGATQRETKTVGEWRAAAERHGVDTDAITVTDVQRLTRSVKSDKMDGLVKNLLAKPSGDTLAPLLRHLAVQGAVPGGAGAAAGAIAGLTSDEKDDLADRISRVVGLMGVGFFAGAAGKTNYDMFLSQAFKARRDALDGGATTAKAWRIARETALRDSMETLKASARVGAGSGILGAGAAFHTGDFLLTGGGTAAAMAASRLGLEGLSHFAGGVGRSVERQARYVNWLTGMKKGLPEDAAAQLVNKTLFDYQDLSWSEKYVLRRVFPFWTWNSKNVALQGWLMENRPGNFMMMDRILNLQTKETIRDQDMAGIPNYMRYRIVMALGPGKVLSGLGIPIESIAELSKPGRIGSYSLPGLGGILSNMNPIVPFAMRFLLGTDPYYRVDITNIRSARDVRYLPESLQDWVGLAQVAQKDRHGRVVGIKYETGHKGVGKEQGAYRMALLRSLPTWRLVSEYNKIVADTFMTGTAARAGERRATPSEKVAAFLFAWRSYSLDPAAMEDRMWYFYERALQDIGKSEGWLGGITITKRPEPGRAP